jgi:hypothetical protein
LTLLRLNLRRVFFMNDELVAYALNLFLDDLRVGEWVTSEVDKRLGRQGPQDHEFWAMYTTVTNELLDAVRKKNEPADLTPTKTASC